MRCAAVLVFCAATVACGGPRSENPEYAAKVEKTNELRARWEKSGAAILAGAESVLSAGDAELAKQMIEPYIGVGGDAARRFFDRANAKIRAREIVANRKKFETARRNRFLDDGFDVQVRVSGPDNLDLVYEFALFDAVWARRFETSDELLAVKAMGFRRFEIRNGRGWSTRWTFDG
jgi:hypothetical protein